MSKLSHLLSSLNVTLCHISDVTLGVTIGVTIDVTIGVTTEQIVLPFYQFKNPLVWTDIWNYTCKLYNTSCNISRAKGNKFVFYDAWQMISPALWSWRNWTVANEHNVLLTTTKILDFKGFCVDTFQIFANTLVSLIAVYVGLNN